MLLTTLVCGSHRWHPRSTRGHERPGGSDVDLDRLASGRVPPLQRAPRRPPYTRLDHRSDTGQDDSADRGRPRRRSSTLESPGPRGHHPEPLPEELFVTLEPLAALRDTFLR